MLKILPDLMEAIKTVQGLDKLGLGSPGADFYEGPSAINQQYSPEAGLVPHAESFQPPNVPGNVSGIEPSLPQESGGRMGRIQGKFDEIDSLIKSVPILGDITGQLEPNSQSARLRSAEKVAGAGDTQATHMAMWKEMQKNIRAANTDQARRDVGGMGAAATRYGADVRAGSEREKNLTKILDIFGMAGKDQRGLLEQKLMDAGYDISKDPEGKGILGWMKSLGAKALEKLASSIATAPSDEEADEVTKRPPLGSFQR